jgi:hypothetical protein
MSGAVNVAIAVPAAPGQAAQSGGHRSGRMTKHAASAENLAMAAARTGETRSGAGR